MYKTTGRFYNTHRKSPNTKMTMWDGVVVPGKLKKNGRPRKAVILAPIYVGQQQRTEPAQKGKDRRLYLVEFRLRADRSVRFFKLGVSGSDIEIRFAGDATRYEIKALALSVFLKEADAFALEGSYHTLFASMSYRPEVPLVSGNTECYKLPDDLLAKIRDMLSAQRHRRVGDASLQPSAPPIGGGVTERRGGGYYRAPVGKGKPDPGRHGTKLRYDSGCRCPRCKAAQKQWRSALLRTEAKFGAGARAQKTPAKSSRWARYPDAPPITRPSSNS